MQHAYGGINVSMHHTLENKCCNVLWFSEDLISPHVAWGISATYTTCWLRQRPIPKFVDLLNFEKKTHVRWCFFKQVTRSRSHILLSWETEEVMIQFPSGLFLRRAMILIRGGSDYTSIAEQQSSVDLERENMFQHCHELWCYQHGQFTLHKMRSVLLFSRALPLSTAAVGIFHRAVTYGPYIFLWTFPKIWFSVRVWWLGVRFGGPKSINAGRTIFKNKHFYILDYENPFKKRIAGPNSSAPTWPWNKDCSACPAT